MSLGFQGQVKILESQEAFLLAKNLIKIYPKLICIK